MNTAITVTLGFAPSLPNVRSAQDARVRYSHRPQCGAAILYVVVLSPILMLVVALAAQLGALQLQRESFRSAVDEAVVIATSSASTSGTNTTVDSSATQTAVRQSIADNLTPLTQLIAGSSPQQIAAAATVSIAPSSNAGTGTIKASVRVPVHTGLLVLAGVPSTIQLTVAASSDLARGSNS